MKPVPYAVCRSRVNSASSGRGSVSGCVLLANSLRSPALARNPAAGRTLDDAGGGSYQNLINRALRAYVERSEEPLEAILRRVVREELRRAS